MKSFQLVRHLDSPESRREVLPELEELNLNFGSNPDFSFAGKDVFAAYNELGLYIGFGCIGYNDFDVPVLRYDLVDPLYRGLKIQKKLIEARIHYIKSKRFHKWILAYVDPENMYSLNNLVDCGFRFDQSRLARIKNHQYQSLKLNL